jgi:KDO2-lipid IV(A) lauroyltransferase
VGYRKKVVLSNLRTAFPEKTETDLLIISKKFYRHFTDVFMEMLKTFSISDKEILKRFKLINPVELKEFMAKHDNVMLMSSHHANFEWLFSLNLLVDHHGFAAYKKLKNKYFNNFVIRSRGRFNTTLVDTKEFIATLDHNHRNKMACVYGMLTDQSPKLSKTFHWSTFFGVEVPVITGTEMLANKYDYPVIYIETSKVKRGYYQARMEVLSENPRAHEHFEITDRFMQKLEAQIRRQPEYYFWTHKRFKHMRTAIVLVPYFISMI